VTFPYSGFSIPHHQGRSTMTICTSHLLFVAHSTIIAVNFLSLLHPSSSPYVFASRIIKSSDQQASLFLQQKLKVADSVEEMWRIVDAICARGFEMMVHRCVFLMVNGRCMRRYHILGSDIGRTPRSLLNLNIIVYHRLIYQYRFLR
jgi:hypothetical protein